MTTIRTLTLTLTGCAAVMWSIGRVQANEPPQFTRIERLPNKETAFTLSTSPGAGYRVQATTNLSSWNGLVTLPISGVSSVQFTDSATPFMLARYYRAEELGQTNAIAGDHLPTSDGDVVIQPRFHATFVMSWAGRMIFVDPTRDATYTGLPKADLILVTHSHSDHLDTSTIDAVRGTNAVIVAPQDVFSKLTTPERSITRVLGYGASTNVIGLTVEAVPAYNATYHPFGTGNGYIVTIGGKRIYISGDTGDTTEMRALTGIDVAFICINQPYTMTVSAATNAVAAFHPKVVYPYHFRDQSGSTAGAAQFKQQLGPGLGIEIRVRKWY